MRIKDIEEVQDLCVNVIKVGEVIRFVDVVGSYGDITEEAIQAAGVEFERHLVELKSKLDSLAILQE